MSLICKRAFVSGAAVRPAAQSSSETSNTRPVATAKSAFCTICRPGTGNCARQRCAPSRIVKSVPVALWLISSARIMPALMPAKITFPRARAAIVFVNESSAFKITLPLAATASASAPFSSAIFSREPMNSMCATPIFVMIATSGAASCANAAISPG